MIKNYNAGNYQQQFQYKSFTPSLINRDFQWEDRDIVLLHDKARGLLGKLDAYADLVPDIAFCIRMNIIKEATTSNKIEGTRTGIDEAVLPEEEIKPENRDDWSEVQNYIKAINYSIKKLPELPLSVRLIKETHRILLAGVRGREKKPGELRISQNWIGGSSLSDAFFIPPTHQDVPELMSDLEKFWHNDTLQILPLVKMAIMHYQFETIHPFLDGNGRLGRLLIVLQLVESGILTEPSLYLSAFFEKHRVAYYDSLTMVRHSHDLEQWIKFFLNGVITTAQDGIDTFKSIVALRQQYLDKMMAALGNRRAERTLKLLSYMFSRPIINVKTAEKELEVSFNSANRLLQELVNLGMLQEITGYSRNRLFALYEYLDLFMK